MFLVIHELVGKLDLQKQSGRVNLVHRARLLVLVRLNQIRAVAGTIERHFALLAAALRANTPVNGGAKTFLFADFTNSPTQYRAPNQGDDSTKDTTLARIPSPRPHSHA